jgi:hypothetical protein
MRLSACLISLLGLTLFPAISPALSIVMPTIGELVLQPDRFYNQQVSVAGTIADYNEHISTQGKAYSIFRLDNDRSVYVFSGRHHRLHSGLRVKVTGTFKKDNRVDSAAFFLALSSKEERPVDFPLAGRLIDDGPCCACGYFHFAWSVRHRHPASAPVVEFFDEIQGSHLSFGASEKGQGDAGICDPILAVNRTVDRLLVDIQYTVAFKDGIQLQRIEVLR